MAEYIIENGMEQIIDGEFKSELHSSLKKATLLMSHSRVH